MTSYKHLSISRLKATDCAYQSDPRRFGNGVDYFRCERIDFKEQLGRVLGQLNVPGGMGVSENGEDDLAILFGAVIMGLVHTTGWKRPCRNERLRPRKMAFILHDCFLQPGSNVRQTRNPVISSQQRTHTRSGIAQFA